MGRGSSFHLLGLRSPLMRFLSALFAGTVATATSAAPCDTPSSIDLASLRNEVGAREVVFVATDLSSRCWISDTARASERQTPWSTFKIPHSLIALETGSVAGPDEVLAWSPDRHPAQAHWPKDWAQPQSLSSAFDRSAAWYFQELVPRVGAQAYRRWLTALRYGNASVAPGNSAFWLDGTLTISPIEQVDFLVCILKTGCGFSPRALSTLDAIALDGEASGISLFGKTGSGPQRAADMNGPFEGWYVGYLRDANGQATAAFALFVKGPSFSTIGAFRRTFARTLLRSLALWPGR